MDTLDPFSNLRLSRRVAPEGSIQRDPRRIFGTDHQPERSARALLIFSVGFFIGAVIGCDNLRQELDAPTRPGSILYDAAGAFDVARFERCDCGIYCHDAIPAEIVRDLSDEDLLTHTLILADGTVADCGVTCVEGSTDCTTFDGALQQELEQPSGARARIQRAIVEALARQLR